MSNVVAGEDFRRNCRKPDILADAAYAILCRDAKESTGRFFIDDEVLKEEGVSDFDQYKEDPSCG